LSDDPPVSEIAAVKPIAEPLIIGSTVNEPAVTSPVQLTETPITDPAHGRVTSSTLLSSIPADHCLVRVASTLFSWNGPIIILNPPAAERSPPAEIFPEPVVEILPEVVTL